MKIDKKYRPELVLDKSREADVFRFLYLDVAKKVLVATNGHILLRIPASVGDRDVSGFIPSEAIECARSRAQEKGLSQLFIKAMKTKLVIGDAAFVRPPCEKYPDYWGLINRLPSPDTAIIFGVDMNCLDRLRASLGVDANKKTHLFFSFDPNGKRNSEGGYEDTIRVYLQTKKESVEVALIAPVRWYNNNPEL